MERNSVEGISKRVGSFGDIPDSRKSSANRQTLPITKCFGLLLFGICGPSNCPLHAQTFTLMGTTKINFVRCAAHYTFWHEFLTPRYGLKNYGWLGYLSVIKPSVAIAELAALTKSALLPAFRAME
jgi:hypothetical protein